MQISPAFAGLFITRGRNNNASPPRFYCVSTICVVLLTVKRSLVALYTVNKKRSVAASLSERFGLLRMLAYVVRVKF